MSCGRTIGQIFLLTVLYISVGCSLSDRLPADVVAALDSAGDNRTELERVITHYKENANDSLKLEAAMFLIGNMPGHGYATYRLKDAADATVELDAPSYADYETLLAAVDSIEKQRGELDYSRLDFVSDATTIAADLLISHIDLAFEMWREKSWSQRLSFEQFRRYVLPYRSSNEPLEDWRKGSIDRYAAIVDGVEDPNDPVLVASAINDEIIQWFRFDERYYFHPTDQGVSEMVESKMGRCEDMANLAICAMRANGIAVMSDYTPYWANTGNNHAWNAILDGDGKVVPFMGAEANPRRYRLYNRPAKVYRKTFERNPHNLAFQDRKQEAIPRWLAGRNYIDVTADYVEVCDLTLTFAYPIPDSVDIAYLCVFNDGEFQPIHWGRVSENRATFTAMGSGIVYLPATYQNEEVIPCGAPFVLDGDCIISELLPDPSRPTSVTISNLPVRAQVASTETVKTVSLTVGKQYELRYWDDGWQVHCTFTADAPQVSQDSLPADGLYWLIQVDGGQKERIFTIVDGEQVFW